MPFNTIVMSDSIAAVPFFWYTFFLFSLTTLTPPPVPRHVSPTTHSVPPRTARRHQIQGAAVLHRRISAERDPTSPTGGHKRDSIRENQGRQTRARSTSYNLYHAKKQPISHRFQNISGRTKMSKKVVVISIFALPSTGELAKPLHHPSSIA